MKKILHILSCAFLMFAIANQVSAQAGQFDNSFNGTGKKIVTTSQYGNANDVAVQPDGKTVMVGRLDVNNYNNYDAYPFSIVRLNEDGTTDQSFGNGGNARISIYNQNNYYYYNNYSEARSVAIQPDGKILVAGIAYSAEEYYNYGYYVFTVIRLNSDGSLDLSFGGGDGIAQFNPSNYNNSSEVFDMAVQTDGKILLAGSAYDYTYNYYGYGTWSYAVVRFNPDGAIDNTYGDGTGVFRYSFNYNQDYYYGYYNYSYCYAIALTNDNKAVLNGVTRGGDYNYYYNDYTYGVVRVNSNGTLDQSFNGTGSAKLRFFENYNNNYYYSEGRSVAIQADNKIVVGGHAYDYNAEYTNRDFYKIGVARFNVDGSLDNSFNGTGKKLFSYRNGDITNQQLDYNTYSYSYGFSLVIQDNQQILIGGYSDGQTYNSETGSYQSNNGFSLARLNTNGSMDLSFGTNGKGTAIYKLTPNEYTGYSYSYSQSMAKALGGKVVMAGRTYDYTIEREQMAAIRILTNNDCPATTTVNAAPNACTAVVNNIASHFELREGETLQGVTYTINGVTTGSGTGDASGTTFNMGTSFITYTGTILDAAEQVVQRQCTFSVIVKDVTAPAITCLPAVQLPVVQGYNYVLAQSLVAPVATDLCGSVTVTNNAYSYLYVGNHVITWTATDAAGNTSTCTQNITVVEDIQPPVLTCPEPIVVSTNQGCSAIVNFAATATDNSGTANISYSIQPGSSFNVGVTTVNVTATDLIGNQSTCSFTVTVNDTEAPVAKSTPVAVTLVNGVATISAADVNNGSTDNCGIASISVSNTTFSCANIGSNSVTLTVTDIHGNTSTTTAIVTVVGEIPTATITAIPSSNVYTGGVPTNIYLGYGAQSVTLSANATNGAPYTYQWSGNGTLSNTNTANPVFAPTAAGSYTFTVLVTNTNGCVTTATITICVRDIRVPGTAGKKVYVCHVPPGNNSNPQTLEISVNAVSSHIGAHSQDRLGSCAQPACGTVTNAPQSTNNKAQALTELTSLKSEEELAINVLVMPNPSAHIFTLKIQSKNNAPVQMRITDATGRAVESRANLGANSTLQVGSNFVSGTYYAEFTQGNQRKVVQLIKVRR